jgi:hypothetical protein
MPFESQIRTIRFENWHGMTTPKNSDCRILFNVLKYVNYAIYRDVAVNQVGAAR